MRSSGRQYLRKSLLASVLLATLGAGSARAQQNFFNVPSSEITPKGKLFFQQQLNVAETHQQSSTTLDLGLGKNFEVGVNYAGLSIIDDRKAHPIFNDSVRSYNPFLLVNAQKRLELGEHLAVALGGQFGVTTTLHVRNGGLVYCNMVYHNDAFGLKAVAGPYYASSSYFGEGTRLFNDLIGLQAGFEKSIVHERLVLQTDFISGTHDLGEVVPGAAWYLTPHWILSAGYQVPTFGSSSIHSLVFEITYSPPHS